MILLDGSVCLNHYLGRARSQPSPRDQPRNQSTCRGLAAPADQVSASTEQTSASTQEMAASAQDLATTAEELNRLVEQFRVAG